MEKKCDYCDNFYIDTLTCCPYCAAPNSNVGNRSYNGPTTISELKQWYVDHHLPPETITRFFIGKNVHEPKAFGIYEDEFNNFVVYKNKADGQRAIRYNGKDEAYAVNELYQRLQAEISNQKSRIRRG